MPVIILYKETKFPDSPKVTQLWGVEGIWTEALRLRACSPNHMLCL